MCTYSVRSPQVQSERSMKGKVKLTECAYSVQLPGPKKKPNKHGSATIEALENGYWCYYIIAGHV
jgi:hypothetical protein